MIGIIESYKKFAHEQYERLPSDWFAPYQKSMANPLIDWRSDWQPIAPIKSRRIDERVLICAVDFFAQQYPMLANQYIFNAASCSWSDNQVAAYVQAFWQQHIVIYVPSGHSDHTIDLADTIADASAVLLITIIVDEGSSLTIRDTRTHDLIPVMFCSYQIIVRSGAQCRLVQHQERAQTQMMLASIHVLIEQQAIFDQEGLYCSGAFFYLDSALHMRGIGSQARIAAVSRIGDAQRQIITTQQIHSHAQTTSCVQIKGTVDGAARMMYTGMIRVAQEAERTHATQEHKTMLLHADAHAQSIPSLEVNNSAVSCAHGAAISRIDRQQVQYMGTRGFSEKNAEKALIQGFLADILSDDYLKKLISCS